MIAAVVIAFFGTAFALAALLGSLARRDPAVTALTRRIEVLGYGEQGRLGVWWVRDPRIPFAVRYLPLTSFVYWVAPFDFIPDGLPRIGRFDDRCARALALWCLLRWSPAVAVEEQLQRIEYLHEVLEARLSDE